MCLAVNAAAYGASAETTLPRQMARCAELGNDRQRLACYDELARNAASSAGRSQGPVRIQPPASFLDSHLVAVPWKAEYHLTVRDFVRLITHAVMDSGKHVIVQGWSRDRHDYVLSITMRSPLELHFLPRESATGDISMSLLREVTMDGYAIDAGQFIMIIAAMAPDAVPGDANAQVLP